MVFNARHSLPVEAELGATYGRGRQLTVLNVAYPLAPVGPGAVGGAEQIVAALDQALTRVGHRSLVVACQGSWLPHCRGAVRARIFGRAYPRSPHKARRCHRIRFAAVASGSCAHARR